MDAVEIELKFQVPASARAAVRRALATATAQTVHLRAAYADTADQRLAGAAMALRLRQEGRHWVQTLKGRGDGLMQRLEHEVPLPPQRGVPVLDPARHAGSAAGDALARLLADGAPLQERYRTDIRRLLRRVRSGGAVVEIAFDEGRIHAGSASVPVCEIEFELVSGPPQALLALAQRWVQRHGLWLDVVTKSERGHRLALGLKQVPATRAFAPLLRPETSPAGAFAALLQAALAQALPNAAELAAGSGSADHLHQLRVGLRRLRTVLHLLAPWSADPAAAAALAGQWRAPFRALGSARDGDVLVAWLQPALAAAGAPPLAWAAPRAPDTAGLLRDPAFSILVLQTMQLALAVPAHADTPLLAEAARAVLKPAWRRAMADARQFKQLPADAQHRLRRRLKRLRYSIEFLQPVLRDQASTRALAALGRALDALGACNDALMAQRQLQALPEQTPASGFALGWLAARQAPLQRRAARRLQALAATRRCWR